MQKNLPAILVKLFLIGAEFAFVCGVFYLRFLNIGWMFIIFGLGLLLWALVHFGLLATLIASARPSWVDLLLYPAVHFFYLVAWLLQSDGGDDGNIVWTIQHIFDNNALLSFLQKWGDDLSMAMAVATLLCYVLIVIVLIVRLVRWLASRRSNAQPAG